MLWTSPGDGGARAMTERWRKRYDARPGGSPVLGSLLDGFLHGYAQFFLWIATLSAFAGMGALFRCGRGRISVVVGAVVGVVAHPVLLWFGRHGAGSSH
jgi:hypothetical protein